MSQEKQWLTPRQRSDGNGQRVKVKCQILAQIETLGFPTSLTDSVKRRRPSINGPIIAQLSCKSSGNIAQARIKQMADETNWPP